MRFLFSTGSLYTYGIDRCFDLAARAGFDGMELMTDGRWDTRQPDYLKTLTDRFGLSIVAIHIPLEDAVAPGWPDDNPGRIRETVALAETLGAEVVVHHLPLRFRMHWIQVGRGRAPMPLPGRDAYKRWLIEDYAALQATTSVTLCIENMPARQMFGRRVQIARRNTPKEIVRFPTLTLDTTHLGTWGLDSETVYQMLRERVRHVHLSNFNGREHRRPEDGSLELDRLLARLATDGFTGAITLELSPDALDAGAPDDTVLTLLKNSLAYCHRAVA